MLQDEILFLQGFKKFGGAYFVRSRQHIFAPSYIGQAIGA
jgi:hypothetical protein